MPYPVTELCDRFSAMIMDVRHPEAEFSRIDSTENYREDSLIFVSDTAQLGTTPPAVIVTTDKLAASIADHGSCVISVADVRVAQALIRQFYCDYDASDSEWDAIHPSAVIHPSAKLAADVRIGANTVVGKNVVIGQGTQVRANCVLEHDAVIGSDCIINNLVNIGYQCLLGDRVILRSGAIIGNEGFGFGQDQDSRYQRIPHTGIVEIQDDVQIGANCNIDRGTYGKTVIARGVKIDALCHVGHNCLVDEDALFVAQTGVAGSTRIGKRVVASGQTGIIDHRTIADDAILVHRCGVTEDIPNAGMWAGTPPKPFKEYVRGLNLDKKIEKLSARLKDLEHQRSK